MADKPHVSISKNQAWSTPENHKDIQRLHLRSYPAMAKCETCSQVGFSRGERSINWLNCLFCYCCNCCWWCYMNYKWKDLNCFNVKHTCSNCGKDLAEYNACS